VRTFHFKKEIALSFGAAFALSAIPLVQSKPTKPAGFAPVVSDEVASSTLPAKSLGQEIHIEKPDLSDNSFDCDIFDDPNSVACLGLAKGYQPTNNVERLVQKGATYATRFVPMLNKGAKYCSKSDGSADSTSGCTVANFTETLKSFGGSCSDPYEADDAKASESLTEGTMRARLTNSAYVTATDCDATHWVGALALNTSVVIEDSTAGLEVKFTVSNSGMTIIPTDSDGDVVGQFGGGPFQAVFSLY